MIKGSRGQIRRQSIDQVPILVRPDYLVTWSLGHLFIWSPGHLVTWLPVYLVTWSPGHLVTWSSGPHIGTA